jgi:hypothetical protein
MTAKAVD